MIDANEHLYNCTYLLTEGQDAFSLIAQRVEKQVVKFPRRLSPHAQNYRVRKSSMRGIQEVAASSTGHVTTCKATIHTEYTVLYIVFEFYSVYKSTLKRRIHLNNCTMSSIQSYTGAIVKRIMFSSIIRRKCFIKPLEILILGVWSCQNPTALLSFSHDWAFS